MRTKKIDIAREINVVVHYFGPAQSGYFLHEHVLAELKQKHGNNYHAFSRELVEMVFGAHMLRTHRFFSFVMMLRDRGNNGMPTLPDNAVEGVIGTSLYSCSVLILITLILT